VHAGVFFGDGVNEFVKINAGFQMEVVIFFSASGIVFSVVY
jgi:hypothetical protein